MIKNLKVSKTWGAFYYLCLFTSLIIPFVNIISQIVLFVFASIACVYLAKPRGILHPLSWFPIFYLLYGVSFVIYSLMVGDDHLTSLNRIIPLSFYGFLGFITPLIFFKKNTTKLPDVIIDKRRLKIIWLVSILIAFLLIQYVISSGFTSKREFLDSIGVVGNFFIIFTIIPLLYCINIIQEKKVQIFNSFFIITLFILFLGFGVTGERDFVFKFLFFVFILYYSIKPYKISIFMLSILLALSLMPLSQATKGYLINSEYLNYDYEFKVSSFFYNDFYAAGRSLNYMLEKNVPLMYGETFVWDVKRFFSFIFSDQKSTGAWFNNDFRAYYQDFGNSGWGFSLVAEANMNFGGIGVFCLYSLIGLMSGLIYRASNRNLYLFIYYLLYIITTIYVTRADFANFLSLNFKINIAIIIFIYLSLKIQFNPDPKARYA